MVFNNICILLHRTKVALALEVLTLPILRLFSSKEQGHLVFTGYLLLSTLRYEYPYLPGFLSFFRFFVSFCIGQISNQQHKGYNFDKPFLVSKLLLKV